MGASHTPRTGQCPGRGFEEEAEWWSGKTRDRWIQGTSAQRICFLGIERHLSTCKITTVVSGRNVEGSSDPSAQMVSLAYNSSLDMTFVLKKQQERGATASVVGMKRRHVSSSSFVG